MKFLSNKKLKLQLEPGKKGNYADLITICIDNVPEKGFTREDFKQRDRIEETMKKFKNGNFKFEDQDAENLKTIVELMRWQIRDKEIKTFLDDVAEMKEVTNTK